MRALLCHCRTHLEAKDDPSLAEEVKEHLLREHPALRPTDEQVWEIVSTRAYDFEVFDPQYAQGYASIRECVLKEVCSLAEHTSLRTTRALRRTFGEA
jgi:hypothetical protein